MFNLSLKALEMDVAKSMQRLGIEEQGKIQQFIDNEVLRKNDPYVPKDNGDLIKSGDTHTKPGSGVVVYSTPYARKQYYIPMEHKEGKRCAYWFEVMKSSGGKEEILNGARKLIGK